MKVEILNGIATIHVRDNLIFLSELKKYDETYSFYRKPSRGWWEKTGSGWYVGRIIPRLESAFLLHLLRDQEVVDEWCPDMFCKREEVDGVSFVTYKTASRHFGGEHGRHVIDLDSGRIASGKQIRAINEFRKHQRVTKLQNQMIER